MRLKHFAIFSFLAFISTMASAADFNPTAKDIEAIDIRTGDYFSALDLEKYELAYGMLSPEMKKLMNFEKWTSIKKKTDTDLGQLSKRSRTRVTWYKDPENAPAPGLYVAVDFVSNYSNASSHEEYIVWYRFDENEEFKLMRHEVTFMLKNEAGEKRVVKAAPLDESRATDINYKTVAEARTALSSNTNNIVSKTDDGWFVVQEPKANAVWSFSPPGYLAYPAVVKRFTEERDGSVVLVMNVICEAKKAPCDELVREFQKMNEKIQSGIK